MTRILGPTGSARRRRTLLGVFASFLLLTLFVVPNALAVHDLNFQLDGDVDSSTTTSIGGTTQNLDWDTLFDANGDEVDPLPAGFTEAGFEPDFEHTGDPPAFVTSDTTTFATGSKDTLPISGWQCNFDNNVNSKVDVMNAYAASFTDPGSGDQIIYFALERNTNTGDANVAFWFLQDDVGCETAGGSEDFTGGHVNGDLLIVSAFTKGGDVSTIDVYEWVGDDATGSLNPDPIASGVDCRDVTDPSDLPDDACAAANRANITTPWLTANFKDGVGTSLRAGELFEGGVNLTAQGLGGECFNVFIGDTRSAPSLTATLFDFARGVLGECGVEVNTTPSDTSITLGDTVSDHAVVTGTGTANPPVPTGTMKFFICGPDELDDPVDTTDDPDLCDVGGTAVNGATSGTADEPLAPTGNPSEASADSAAFEPDAVGTWCWRGEYSGEKVDPDPPNNYDPAVDFDASECLTVGDLTTASTAQTWLPNDSATISSQGGSDLDGTVTFTLFDNGTCDGNVLFTENIDVPEGTASGSTFSTTNGDAAADPPGSADIAFDVEDSPLTVSWLAVFNGTPANSTAPCETSTVTIDDDITSPAPTTTTVAGP